jgi:asparagine synthase (glutamine-hydrolysing)
MCGIAGFAGRGDYSDLVRMNSVLHHRGPDDEGFWHDAGTGIYLAHKRLAVIDPHDGAQPMLTADNASVVIFNGEIYNHAELREELVKKGCAFRTHHSDTEVLLHGYRQWGGELCNRLNGMWAFAVYDTAARQLFLSRDRFGKKPLYYTHRNGVFAFASELTALVQHSALQSAELSRDSLKKYFAYGYIPAPHSVYERINKLPAGCSLTYDLDTEKIIVSRYWDFVLEPFDAPSKRQEGEWCEELRVLLDRAVRRRLVSDVPLGVFLSGGIDSTAVAAFAARHVPEGGRLKTFSISFEERSFDESRFSRCAAEALGTDHHCDTMSIEKAFGLLPQIAGRLDEPMGDSSLLPYYLLCQNARREVTVALGGDGADELFGGYDPFRALGPAQWFDTIVPRPLHPAIRALVDCLPASHRNMSFDFRLKRVLRGLAYPRPLWNPVWYGPLAPAELTELFNEPCRPEDVYAEAIALWDSCRSEKIFDKTLMFYTKLYLQDDILAKIDRAGMLNSLEVRAPFLDIDLVDFARKIPSGFKFRHGKTKYLLKKAMEPILPCDSINRPKKGFGVPVGAWFRDGQLSCSSDAALGLNSGFIQERIFEHCRGRCDHRGFLWNLWLLQNWASSLH